MKIEGYIKSGILEAYCLGALSADEQADVLEMCALFPEIQNQLTAIQSDMEKMAAKRAVTPSAEIKEKILRLLGFPNFTIKLEHDNLPPIDSYSNHRSWLDAVQHLIPAKPSDSQFYQVALQQSGQIKQSLVILGADVPVSVHETERESFFILKGECKCVVGNNFFLLGPGDFLEIPLNTMHKIKLITATVVAILQYLPVTG